MDIVNAKQTDEGIVIEPDQRDQGSARRLGHHPGADPQHGHGRQGRASRSAARSRASVSAPPCRARTSSCRWASSHEVVYQTPAGITLAAPTATEVVVTGADKQQVGQVAANIRAVPQAGALQGQGRALRGRVHRPQRRQEEVRSATMAISLKGSDRRKARVRNAPSRRAPIGRPRLSVFRSDKNIYAQIIDDATGPHARRRLDARQGRQGERQERRDRRGGADDRQADRRARQGGQVSARSCSTAAPTCITAGSRPWPTRPAKAGCSSEPRQRKRR